MSCFVKQWQRRSAVTPHLLKKRLGKREPKDRHLRLVASNKRTTAYRPAPAEVAEYLRSRDWNSRGRRKK